MNSDEIERLQRARATTAPEVSRPTQTPPPLPAFVLRHRRKDETLRTNEMSFWRLLRCAFKRFWVAWTTNDSFVFLPPPSMGFRSGHLWRACVVLVCTGNDGFDVRIGLRCETGAAAGQETCVNADQPPAVTQVAMAVDGAAKSRGTANPAANPKKIKVFFPPLMR